MSVNYRKIIQALNYFAFCQENNTLEKIKAYKLIWLADRYHVRQYGRFITEDNYYALPHGPVPSDTKSILDKSPAISAIINTNIEEFIEIIDNNFYKSAKEPNMKVFSKSEQDALAIVNSFFGKMKSYDLSEYSHTFPEWVRFKKDIEDNREKNSHKINIEDFFLNIKEESGLFDDDEVLINITKQLYSETHH